VTESKPVLLVVDDEPGIVRLVEGFARKFGFEVDTAGSGHEAMAKLESDKAAVSTRRSADARRRRPGQCFDGSAPRIRIARSSSTGHASVETAIDAIKLGAMDYLSKPFDFDPVRREPNSTRAGRGSRLFPHACGHAFNDRPICPTE